MAQVSGIVTEIKAKATRVGDMYDVIVNGVAYGNGKYPPRGVKAGDFVTFEFEEKQNGQYTNRNIIAKTMRVDDNPAPAAVSAAKATTAVNVAAADKRQETISKQANLNTALTLVGLQLQHGAIKVPAKPADANTVINTIVFDTAAKLYKLTTGEDWDIELPEDGKKKAVAEADTAEGEYAN